MLKKCMCVVMAAIIFLSVNCCVFAGDATEYNEISEKNYVDILCVYDKKSSKINISGTVSHDLFISHKGDRVRLYKLDGVSTLSDEMLNEEFLPIAEIDISIKFNFSLSVNSIYDIFSKYVIVIVGPDGQIDYVSNEFYPSVESKYVAPLKNKSHYKGIDISSSFAPIKGVPSTVTIDVDVDNIISDDFMGYLHTLDGESIFFDRETINSLDMRVKTLSASEVQIYFRLVSRDEAAKPLVPDCSDPENIKKIYTVCDFLAERYKSQQNGILSGFVVGERVDYQATMLDDDSFGEFIDNLGIYTMVIANALRSNIPSGDVVISLSDDNSYSIAPKFVPVGRAGDTIEGLCEFFDRSYGDDFEFSLMLETYVTPYDIDSINIEYGVDLSYRADANKIGTHNIGDFVLYLDKLDNTYENAPKTFKYYWHTDEYLSGNALACAYTYTYYKLFIQSSISSFIVDVDSAERFGDIYNIFKYIDTPEGEDQASFLLGYFDIDHWGDIISPTFADHDLGLRFHKSTKSLTGLPNNVKGEFNYFNYTEGISSSYWQAGEGTLGIFVDYSSTIGRALRMQLDKNDAGEYSYFFWRDTYPENYEYTPYIAFNFCVEEDGTDSGGLFEVKFEVGSGANIVESIAVVSSNKASMIVLDIREFASEYLGDYIKISIRSLSEANEDYSFFLSSVVGYSTELDDTKIAEAIADSRSEIRNKDSLIESFSNNNNGRAIALTVAVIGIILGVMLFFFLRHDEEEE